MLKYRYRNIIKGDMEMIWKNFSVGLSLRYNSFMENIDAIFTDPLISIYVPGVQDSRYYMNNGDLFFDIRAQYRFNKDWKAQIGILNLMNRLSSPRPALLSKPRSFMFQISYELNWKCYYICQPLGGIAQLARALAWHARGRRFDSDYLH